MQKGRKHSGVFLVGIAALSCMFCSAATGADKVVVIPLTVTVEAPLVPFAPVATTSPSNANYTIGPLTVIDKITGLVWQKTDDDTGRDWNAAWIYCHGLTLDSKTDWRLPSVRELTSIVDYSTDNPNINSSAFPGTNSSWYWSATTYATDISSGYAWSVNFYDGGVYNFHDKSNPSYVRCVR